MVLVNFLAEPFNIFSIYCISGIYLAIAVFIIILLFLQMSGFKIKISSLLLSFEFGPEKNQDQTPRELKLAIEEIHRNLKSISAKSNDATKQIQASGDHQRDHPRPEL